MCNLLCPCCPCSGCCPSLASCSPCCKCCPSSDCFSVTAEENDFYNSQWQKIPLVRKWFLIYKVIHLVLLLIILFTSVGLWKGHFLWIIYYAHWVLLACVLQACLGCIITLIAFLRQDKTKTADSNQIAMPCMCSYFYWEVFLLALNQTILVSILYWCTAFVYEDKRVYGSRLFASCLVHAISAIVMLIDLFLVRIPVKMWSSFWSLIFYLGYSIFIIIFHFSGGYKEYENVHVLYSYKIFDWKDHPVMAGLMILIGLVAGILVQLCTFALYLLRKFIYHTCFLVIIKTERDEPAPLHNRLLNVVGDEVRSKVNDKIRELTSK